MRIYISGPITNNPEYMEQFAKAAKTLEARGYKYTNPAELGKVLPDASWHDYMAVCWKLVPMADAITFLEGWETSERAQNEKIAATVWDLELYDLETDTFEDLEPLELEP